MERLTEQMENGQVVFKGCPGTCDTCGGTTYPCMRAMVDRLTIYENLGPVDHIVRLIDAEKSGRIIVLPCKVGDTVYRVIRTKDGGGHIAPAVVSGIHMADTVRGYRYQKNTEYIVLRVDGYYVDHVDVKKFGKTVFLTQEEASAALHGKTPTDN